jgi:putative Ca2+/H+ antiporter (TMEM165/GDT1 family)
MLKAYTAGLLLTTISELGDKTFFIAVILAMRHTRRWVFGGVVLALAAMTVLSVLIGQAVSFLPKHYLDFGEIALFVGFGLKLLYDASQMSSQPDEEEVKSAAIAVEESKFSRGLSQSAQWGILAEAFLLTFLAEWGDRTQITTIALAAANNPLGVTVGAIQGHSICAAIAVIGGRLIAGKISERTVTAIGGGLFLLFGIVAALEVA